jgi:hypothetical protein
MRERHPREIELARLGDREAMSMEMAEHLRWCAHCRSVAADYDWLQGEIAATLEAAAEVPVPRPQWWAVRERVFADQQRQITGWRISALSSVVLAVCLMFSAFPVQSSTVAALTSLPEPIVAPAPATVAVTLVATPTPTTETVPPSTPAFMLPPTPPQTETGGL